MSIADFIQRITEIAKWVDAHVRTKKPEVRADISKAIDTAIAHNAQVVQYILEDEFQTAKTPLYFAHRRDLSPKNRMRKQNFLALYDYLKQAEQEPEETAIIRCYRDVLRNEDTGNAYVGVNLYFISTPSHLDSIEGFMERIRDVFHDAVELWTPELEYIESEISECEAWDAFHASELAAAERKNESGFVFEISDEMDGDWTYWGVWFDRDWENLKIYDEFPIAAVTNLLKRAQL